MSRAGTRSLLALAAVCGAVVMAVELLGARLLGVTYGGSLTVWAAMISVTMLSLAGGYFAGGALADRFPNRSLLCAIVLAAGALIAACPYARVVIKAGYETFGLRGGALASSAAIFAIPLALLGMVSPFIIRLLCADGRAVGRMAGGVYAVSTLGSVAGTLLTGLWLIPACGTATGFRLVAAAAAMAGVAGLVGTLRWKGLPAAAAPLVVALLPAVGIRVGSEYVAPDGDRVEVKAVRESAHGHLVVLDKGRYRLLVVNGIVQTGLPRNAAALSKGQCLGDRYYQELLPYTVDDPSGTRALIIGLAGGMTASMLKLYGVELTCVDLDAAIIGVAREFFAFSGQAEAADGRLYLEKCRKRYDFCVIDTYSGDAFPFQLATREAFQAAKRALKPGGILALNYIGAPGGRAFAAVHLTLRDVFPNVTAIRGEPGDDVQTVTLFASERTIEFNKGWMELAGDSTGVDPVSAEIQRLTFAPSRRDAILLTDDYNPVEFLRAGESLRWRARTAGRIGEQALML